MDLTPNTNVVLVTDENARFNYPEPAVWIAGKEAWEWPVNAGTLRLKWLPGQSIGVLTVGILGNVLLIPGQPAVPLPETESIYWQRAVNTAKSLYRISEQEAFTSLYDAACDLLFHMAYLAHEYAPSLFPPQLRKAFEGRSVLRGAIQSWSSTRQPSTFSGPSDGKPTAAKSGGGTGKSATPGPTPGGRRPSKPRPASRRKKK